MRHLGTILLVIGLVFLAANNPIRSQNGDHTGELRRALEDGTARNILLFIGDGMGDSEITIARNYAVGASGRLAMDSLPFTGEYTTYSVKEESPGVPDYVTDSAAVRHRVGHRRPNEQRLHLNYRPDGSRSEDDSGNCSGTRLSNR
jgi:alkaline phosphatase